MHTERLLGGDSLQPVYHLIDMGMETPGEHVSGLLVCWGGHRVGLNPYFCIKVNG